jgi:hypothetical protein
MTSVINAIDVATHQQIGAAFNMLIQNSVAGDKDALIKFVHFVRLVVATRDIAIRALEEKA